MEPSSHVLVRPRTSSEPAGGDDADAELSGIGVGANLDGLELPLLNPEKSSLARAKKSWSSMIPLRLLRLPGGSLRLLRLPGGSLRAPPTWRILELLRLPGGSLKLPHLSAH